MHDGEPMSPLEAEPTDKALRRKAELELALAYAPGEPGLRTAFFEHLQSVAAGHTGLGQAMLPEVGHPLYFRGATPDVANMAQMFRDQALDTPIGATPRRILVIGAYAGYSAVWLALRYPLAEIGCVEPMPANLRLLALNTGPWRRIRVLGVAAWHSTTRLAVGARLAGDWSPSLHDRAEDDQRVVQAQPVADLIEALHWSHADFVVCDAGGAEAAIFADPLSPWLRQLDLALVHVPPGVAPGLDVTVAACFPTAFYERLRHGEYEMFRRRVPLRAYPPTPPRQKLISDEPGLAQLILYDLEPVPWAFFVFDGDCCQLHPNRPGGPPARAVFPQSLAGQTRFSATLQHAGVVSASVVFTMVLERPDGSEVTRAEQVIAPTEQLTWSVPLPSVSGPHRVTLQTSMAAGAANNNNAWARWLQPQLG